MCYIGNFTSQDVDICLRSFCADSSSPRIPAILAGHLTWDASLRNSPQNFHNKCAREIPWNSGQFLLGQALVLPARRVSSPSSLPGASGRAPSSRSSRFIKWGCSGNRV